MTLAWQSESFRRYEKLPPLSQALGDGSVGQTAEQQRNVLEGIFGPRPRKGAGK